MLKNNLTRIILTIISNVILIISLILVLIFKNNYGYSLYWFVSPILMIIGLLYINRFSVRGLNADTKESLVIQRSFDDSSTLITFFYGLVYLIIPGIDMFNEGIINNPYVIVRFFIITILYELFTYLTINNAKKETRALLEKKYNKKK